MAPTTTEEDAFVALYRERYGPMVRLAYLMVGSRGVAEELVQDAFVSVHRSWSRATHPSAHLETGRDPPIAASSAGTGPSRRNVMTCRSLDDRRREPRPCCSSTPPSRRSPTPTCSRVISHPNIQLRGTTSGPSERRFGREARRVLAQGVAGGSCSAGAGEASGLGSGLGQPGGEMGEEVVDVEVVVVGGGIAGSALAGRLAAGGVSALVLEQVETFRDRVRGETVVPWGVREVVALGVEHVLLGAGGRYSNGFIQYDETLEPAAAEANMVPLSAITPDVSGQLNVGHPEASEALLAHASAAGADVRRGVADVHVTAGHSPEVTWTEGGRAHRARGRLVVGADGRTSTVRRQLGIALEERPAELFGAGLLVRTADGLVDANTFGTEGENCFIAFPRQGDLTRLYLMVDIARQPEFTGPGRAERFLSSFRTACFPGSEAYAAAEVAGPCGGAPMTDSWTVGAPAAPGAVLIGDSAGWNDPLIGQGLSVAFRDARAVSDILLTGSDWTPSAFAPWVDERRERMHRLLVAAHIATRLRCDFTEAGRRRRRKAFDAMFTDANVLAQIACTLMGPEAFPADAFTDEAVAGTLAIA